MLKNVVFVFLDRQILSASIEKKYQNNERVEKFYNTVNTYSKITPPFAKLYMKLFFCECIGQSKVKICDL